MIFDVESSRGWGELAFPPWEVQASNTLVLAPAVTLPCVGLD